MSDDLTSNEQIAALIKNVNARIPSSVTPSTRISIHPSEWIFLSGEIESQARLLSELEASVSTSFYLDGLSIDQWREHAKKGWEASRDVSPPSASHFAPFGWYNYEDHTFHPSRGKDADNWNNHPNSIALYAIPSDETGGSHGA